MYSKYEKPIIRATIYYYDTQYALSTSQAVLEILEKYNMFPPHKIYADRLTKNKYVACDCDTSELFTHAYCAKDVLQIDMASGNLRKTDSFWRINWGLTFYKNSKLAVASPRFLPWNTITIDSTHQRLEDQCNEYEFISLVKELINFLNPFYATIDDVNNKVMLLDQVHETKFVPDRIQQVYWGNYLGQDFCKKYERRDLTKIPSKKVEFVRDGLMFFLSDKILDFATEECHDNRRRAMRFLK